jgi:hypothetical protein
MPTAWRCPNCGWSSLDIGVVRDGARGAIEPGQLAAVVCPRCDVLVPLFDEEEAA